MRHLRCLVGDKSNWADVAPNLKKTRARNLHVVYALVFTSVFLSFVFLHRDLIPPVVVAWLFLIFAVGRFVPMFRIRGSGTRLSGQQCEDVALMIGPKFYWSRLPTKADFETLPHHQLEPEVAYAALTLLLNDRKP